MTDRPTHYLRATTVTTTPRRVAFFDTEAHVREEGRGTVQTFRLAAACLVTRRSDHGHRPSTQWADARTPAELWDFLTGATRPNDPLWVYAHNLGYDLVVSHALVELPRRGWTLEDWSSDRSATWMKWRLGRRRLVLADSAAWLPMPLARIGDLLGTAKGAMPRADAAEHEWADYCRQDVRVLRDAMLTLMEWVERNQLGRWSLSAAGQAWNAWRHRFMHHKVLVSGDAELVSFERAAYYGGRAEIYRHGRTADGPFYDFDLRAAYAAIMAANDLPSCFSHWRQDVTRAAFFELTKHYAVVCDVTVRTNAPLVPCRTDAGLTWPVGEFRTTLCAPEVELLYEKGATVTIHRAALYWRRPLARHYANWVLDGMITNPQRDPAICAAVLKTWSRALFGKFGQQRRSWRPAMLVPGVEYDASDFRELGARYPKPAVVMQEVLYVNERGGETDNSIPIVAAWITSLCRVELWRCMERVGRANIVYADTDGFVTNAAGAKIAAALRPGGFAGALVCKRRYDTFDARLPKDFTADGEPHIKGVPLSARRDGPDAYTFEAWPGLATQLRAGNITAYRTETRRVHLGRLYRRGWLLDDGAVVPLELRLVDGRSTVLAWHDTRWAARGHRPADERQLAELGRSPPARGDPAATPARS